VGAVAWAVIFAWQPVNFWVLMTVGVGGLGALAVRIRGPFPVTEGGRWSDLLLGAAGSVLLYAVFAAGRAVADRVLPFAASEVSAVYALRAQAPAWIVALALTLVIGPGEELFWRGLVQWGLIQRLGSGRGWAAAAILYGLVHVASGNAILVIAATVAGAFWGWLYVLTGRIAPVVVSHILWDLTVFLIFPFR
jgi:uncharacterized protein